MSDSSDLIRTMIDETIDRAITQARTPKFVLGTTTDASDLDNVKVVVDGDTDPIIAPSVIGPLYDGVRVLVMFNPPSGAIIVGYKYTGAIAQRGATVWRTLTQQTNPSIHIGQDAEFNDIGLWVYPSSGNLGIYLGTLLGGAVPAFRIYPEAEAYAYGPEGIGTNRFAWFIDNGRMTSPLINSPWVGNPAVAVDANGRKTFTGAAYTTMYNAYHPLTTDQVDTSFQVSVGAGCTVDVQILVGPPGAPTEVLMSQTGIVATSIITGPWTVPTTAVTPNGNPVGAQLGFAMQARRTAGANTCALAPYFGLSNYV